MNIFFPYLLLLMILLLLQDCLEIIPYVQGFECLMYYPNKMIRIDKLYLTNGAP